MKDNQMSGFDPHPALLPARQTNLPFSRGVRPMRLLLEICQRAGGTVSISLPAKTGVECGLPSGDPPACSTVTA
jgi:hypothetical protein